jgi:hypothetical protein
MMPVHARSRTAALVLLSGILLAGCTSQVFRPVSLPAAIRIGTAGRQFQASFPRTPIKTTYIDSGVKQAQYGVGVESNTTYVSGGDGPPEVNVWVETLTNKVPSRRLNPFLRSYLPTPRGGRIIRWFGLPAAEQFAPGCNPSGQCVGTVGCLVVLDGTSIFFVFTHQNNEIAAQQEIRTFRIVH